MNVSFSSMKVTYHHQYPGGRPMFVVRFPSPRRPSNGERVSTTVEGTAYGGPTIRHDAGEGGGEGRVFPPKGSQQ